MRDCDLSTMSIDELAALRDEAIAVLAEKVAARQRELEQEIAYINGLTAVTAARKTTVRYQHPSDPAKVWSGRGPKPKWIDEELASGRTLDQLAA
jgi:DNA-binding protein H-NS